MEFEFAANIYQQECELSFSQQCLGCSLKSSFVQMNQEIGNDSHFQQAHFK